jgi:biopolymer transport protein ExbD
MSPRNLKTLQRFAARRQRQPRLNMAPMIDCVFLLLIFFMVATTFAPMPGIRVKLPPPSTPTVHSPAKLLVRILNPEGVQTEGTMIINGEIVGFGEIFQRFINAPEPHKTALIIQSDRKVSHGQIVHVVDIAKQAGIDAVKFAPVVGRD